MSFYLVSKKGQLYKCNVYIKPRNLFTRQPLSRPWSTKGPKAVPKAAPPSSQAGAAVCVGPTPGGSGIPCRGQSGSVYPPVETTGWEWDARKRKGLSLAQSVSSLHTYQLLSPKSTI